MHHTKKNGRLFSSMVKALFMASFLVVADFVATTELLENTNTRWSWLSSAQGEEVMYPFLVSPEVSATGDRQLGIQIKTNGMMIVEYKSNLTDSSWMSFTQYVVSSGSVTTVNDANGFNNAIFYRIRVEPL